MNRRKAWRWGIEELKALKWKTCLCCLRDDDEGGDEGALMMLLWVWCPDEEGEMKVSCSCREEALEGLLSPFQEVSPAV